MRRRQALAACGAGLGSWAASLGAAAAHAQSSEAARARDATPAAPHADRSPRLVDLQGHRGARWHLPENTLAGFDFALQAGVTTLELDIVATRDDVLVISHDPALNPDITRDAQGRFLEATGPNIVELTYAQLQAYDVGRLKPGTRYAAAYPEQKPIDGTRIPRLSDLFERVQALGRRDVKYAIETKITPHRPEQTPSPERFVELLLAQVDRFGLADRVQVLSFDWRTLQRLQRARPGVPTVYLTIQQSQLDNVQARSGGTSAWTAGVQHREHGSVPKMVKAAGGTHWSSFWRDLDAANVREAQALGLRVLAWTVNDAPTMHRMLELGVDGLVTDRPELGAQVLRERGLRW